MTCFAWVESDKLILPGCDAVHGQAGCWQAPGVPQASTVVVLGQLALTSQRRF